MYWPNSMYITSSILTPSLGRLGSYINERAHPPDVKTLRIDKSHVMSTKPMMAF